MQPSRPAFETLLQKRQGVLHQEIELCSPQVIGCLFGREAQVAGADSLTMFFARKLPRGMGGPVREINTRCSRFGQ